MPAVTIIIDEENLKKLRELHAKRLQKSLRNVSFSRVVNEILKKGLRN